MGTISLYSRLSNDPNFLQNDYHFLHLSHFFTRVCWSAWYICNNGVIIVNGWKCHIKRVCWSVYTISVKYWSRLTLILTFTHDIYLWSSKKYHQMNEQPNYCWKWYLKHVYRSTEFVDIGIWSDFKNQTIENTCGLGNICTWCKDSRTYPEFKITTRSYNRLTDFSWRTPAVSRWERLIVIVMAANLLGL